MGERRVVVADDELFAHRQSPAFRIAFTPSFAVWLGILGSIALSGEDGPPGWPVLLGLMAAYGIVVFVRMQRTAVIARPAELVVRNLLRSHRLDRADVAGFSTGRYQRVGHQTVQADLRSGRSFRLQALEPKLRFGEDRAIEPVLDRLESWRTQSIATPLGSDPTG